MDRLKTFLKYALWVIGLFILSEFLINVGLNSNYKELERKDNLSQVVIYQAEATKVNGRIRGIIDNSDNKLNGKYIEVDLYSKRNVFLGKKYFEVQTTSEDKATIPFEMLFKLEDVKYYETKIVDEKDPAGELELLPKEWTKPEIIFATALTFLIFWG